MRNTPLPCPGLMLGFLVLLGSAAVSASATAQTIGLAPPTLAGTTVVIQDDDDDDDNGDDDDSSHCIMSSMSMIVVLGAGLYFSSRSQRFN